MSVLIDPMQRSHPTWFVKDEYSWIFERLERIFKHEDDLINHILAHQQQIKFTTNRLQEEVKQIEQASFIVQTQAKHEVANHKKVADSV